MVTLTAVMYHYVRNPETTPYEGIKGEREEGFIKQVNYFRQNFEMATPDSMMEYLEGTYIPKKNLCVLTFDDGLKEHGHFVSEVLNQHGIIGQFFIPTACIEEGYVLPVHKNHFLLASLEFDYYKKSFLALLKSLYPDLNIEIDSEVVAKTYRWDTREVGGFKYLLNYKLPKPIRNQILQKVFEAEIGKEEDFAKELYLSWEEVKSMQRVGMLIGGHSHRHNVLSSLADNDQIQDLNKCMNLLEENCDPIEPWFFSYPFGKLDTFNTTTLEYLSSKKVKCSYTSIVGDSNLKTDVFQLRRKDPKDFR